jgi:hypothetical protein
MNTNSIHADIRTFLVSELNLMSQGQNVQDSIQSLQLWLCPFLSLMENETERHALINELILDVKEFRLINKYKNIYGVTVHCDENCTELTDKVLSYLFQKASVERLAS